MLFRAGQHDPAGAVRPLQIGVAYISSTCADNPGIARAPVMIALVRCFEQRLHRS